jgi:hypothetical protein
MVITEEQKQFLEENDYVVIDNFISDKDCDAIKESIRERVEREDYNIKLSVDIQEPIDKYNEGKLRLEFHGKKSFIEERSKQHFGITFDELYDKFKSEYSFMYYYDMWNSPHDPDEAKYFDLDGAEHTIRRNVIEVYKDCVSENIDDVHILRRLQIYPPGGHIAEHTDGGDGTYSFSISVGDKEGEGGTLRCNNDDIECKKGRCIIMNADENVHEVIPTVGWSRYNYIVFVRKI